MNRMSRYNTYRKLTMREAVGRSLSLLLVIALLTLLMPGGDLSIHHYNLGEPWDGSPIIAKDSFPVLKSPEAIAAERDSLRRYYSPYYQRDEEALLRNLQALDDQIGAMQLGKEGMQYLRILSEKLSVIYDRGIMDATMRDSLLAQPGRQLYIYSRRRSDQCDLQQVLTPKEAYEYLMYDEDSTRIRHDVLAAMQLQRFVQTNLTLDEEKSAQQRQEVENMLVPYIGKPVQVGQKVVDRGQIVDEYTYRALKSMEEFQAAKGKSMRQKWGQLGGQVLYATLMVLLLYFYFHQFRSDYLHSMRSVLLICALSQFFIVVTYVLVQHQWTNLFIVPYCILPIFVRIFLDSRTAFITHLFTVLTCAVCLASPYEFILVQVVAGLTAIYNMRQLSQRSELVRAVASVVLLSLATYLCIDLLHGRFLDVSQLSLRTYAYIVSAGFLTLISYLLLIPIERIFGFTSTVTLVELSNMNNPLLRTLSERAPGTFQHSLQVANLAAEAANVIGAQSQLVRTGALYHDIGKVATPQFFTENQPAVNPHEGLSCTESAAHIIAHVQDGLSLADKYRLPQVIRDFIATHHGEGVARYFYVTYQNQHPQENVDARPFTYPGPDPFTAEQAILMMADSVEAASRSLTEYTEETIRQMVGRIVDAMVQEGRFTRCPITLRDIDDIKRTFCEKLKTIYHSRIQYPELATAVAEK